MKSSVGTVVETVGRALTKAPRVVIRGIGDLLGRRSAPVGSPPGALAIDDSLPPPRISVMARTAEGVIERETDRIDELRDAVGASQLSWIDVQGLGDRAALDDLAEAFGIHPLALADVVHTSQRPKVETYPDHDLLVVRVLALNEAGEMEVEQLSVVVGASYVITFQERYGNILDPVRRRFRVQLGPREEHGGDFLAYAIVDTVVDGYFPLLEAFADHLEDLEEKVMARPRPAILTEVQKTKRTLIMLRRSVWPLREALNIMLRERSPRFTEAIHPYLRDTYDHCVQVHEVTESYREVASELTNTYMSMVANRTNDVMKVLTIMASVFIPLTFIAGVYGMNFEHMPELHERWGYPAVIGVMISVGLGMLLFFWKRGWLGDGRDD